MVGSKINEFDNSEGKVKDFNKIFTATPLDLNENLDVEILDIVDNGFYSNNAYLRNIVVDGNLIQHDFKGELYLNEDFHTETKTRFKYYAIDMKNNIVAKSYTIKDFSEKIGWSENTIKIYISANKSIFRKGIRITRKEI
jgi:hypothetical protein